MYNQSQYNQQPQNKRRKSKKKGSCLGAIFKFLLIIFIILLAIILGLKVKRNKLLKELNEFQEQFLITQDLSEHYDYMKETPSDIEGYTLYNKAEAGLLPGNNSDTDGDGLTDKEEIEIYHSDPLKVSTAEDSIPDGYKATNNIDISNKVTDIPNDIFYTLDNIEIDTTDAANAFCYMEESNMVQNGIGAVQAYRIDNYVGTISVDFRDYIEDNKKYIAFMQYDGVYDTPEEVKIKDGICEFNITKPGVKIGIFEKSQNIEFNSAFNYENASGQIGGNEAILLTSPIFFLINEPTIIIWEESALTFKNSKEASEARSKVIKNNLEQYIDDNVKVHHYYVNKLELNIVDSVLTSLFNVDMLDKIVKEEISNEEKENIKEILKVAFICKRIKSVDWSTLGERLQPTKNETVRVKPSMYMSSFDILRDTLPFPNFGTYVSPGGNCAGFGIITMEVFNKGSIQDPKGSVIRNETELTYDVSDQDKFHSLFEQDLRSFKTTSYWYDNYHNQLYNRNDVLNNQNVGEDIDTTDDVAFLDYIGAMWAKGNNSSDGSINYWNNGYEWEEIEQLKEYFANGDRICYVSMLGGSGHIINAYGMTQDPNDEDVWYIWVYDNNFPDNVTPSIKRDDSTVQVSVNNYIKVTKTNKWTFGGKKESYNFEYFPSSSHPNYRYNNIIRIRDYGGTGTNIIGNVGQITNLTFYDTDLNIINTGTGE